MRHHELPRLSSCVGHQIPQELPPMLKHSHQTQLPRQSNAKVPPCSHCSLFLIRRLLVHKQFQQHAIWAGPSEVTGRPCHDVSIISVYLSNRTDALKAFQKHDVLSPTAQTPASRKEDADPFNADPISELLHVPMPVEMRKM
jgi:hypothetical protein